jgi:hypothetical protein
MFKISTLVFSLLALVGCAQPVYYVPAQRVYVEQQIIIPDRRAECKIHNERIAKCGAYFDPIKRHYCQRDAIANHNSCMHQ